ncbi:head-tail adaptor protein [Sphingomonas sp. MMS24-J13]|uniref:phage head completion protein n=1 Tax=Sphingomonas sp. MMS24-J13 TaxID=3238686 RepID=UPI00384EDE95
MIGIDAGEMDRRLYFFRSTSVDDGTATVPGTPKLIGKRWAKRTEVSDGERVRAAEQSQELSARFGVRSDALTRTITGKDLFTEGKGGSVFEVTGTKEWLGKLNGIEITAVKRPDQAL